MDDKVQEFIGYVRLTPLYIEYHRTEEIDG